MEQKYNTSVIESELAMLRDYCKQEGEVVIYRKGDSFELEGEPSRWIAYVERGCFRYVTHGKSDNKAHITWFSFEGEFVVDYPTFLYDRPSQCTIEAIMPSRVLRISGEKLNRFFEQSIETMKLRAVIGEHILFQFRSRYIDLHCTTPKERYELLLSRCPGIVNELPLNAIASFLNISPQMLSKIRKEITFKTNI